MYMHTDAEHRWKLVVKLDETDPRSQKFTMSLFGKYKC